MTDWDEFREFLERGVATQASVDQILEEVKGESMPYDYQVERPNLFTEHGQRFFLKVRDHVEELLLAAGAFRADRVLLGATWTTLACLDRMVELGEIVEISPTDGSVAGQHRVFTGVPGKNV